MLFIYSSTHNAREYILPSQTQQHSILPIKKNTVTSSSDHNGVAGIRLTMLPWTSIKTSQNIYHNYL